MYIFTHVRVCITARSLFCDRRLTGEGWELGCLGTGVNTHNRKRSAWMRYREWERERERGGGQIYTQHRFGWSPWLAIGMPSDAVMGFIRGRIWQAATGFRVGYPPRGPMGMTWTKCEISAKRNVIDIRREATGRAQLDVTKSAAHQR